MFESAKENIKLSWCEIRSIMNEDRTMQTVSEIYITGTLLKDPESIANQFDK